MNGNRRPSAVPMLPLVEDGKILIKRGTETQVKGLMHGNGSITITSS
jgi:hypothetical protein